MKYQQSQCLILFAVDRVGNRGEIQLLKGKARRTRSVVAAAQSIKAAAFLPEIFCKHRPDVVELFEKNKVHIICNDDELLLLDKNNLWYLLEVIFDDRPKAKVEPVTMISTNYKESDALCWIFPSITPEKLRNSIIIQRCQTFETLARVRFAIDKQNCDVFKELLNANFSDCFYRRGAFAESILELAVRRSQLVLSRVALDQGADIHQGLSDYSLLHWAAQKKSVSMVKLLLDEGATVDARDNEGKTPLHVSSEGQLETVEVLLQAGADVNAKCMEGLTALHCAAFSYSNSAPAIIHLLVDWGAAIDARDEGGRTPLFFATGASIVKMLLENGADANIMSSEQRTVLYNEIKNCGFEQIRILLDFGASIDLEFSGVGILEKVLRKWRYITPNLFTYLLERCFVHHVPLTKAQIIEITTTEWESHHLKILNIFKSHLVMINSLKHHDFSTSESLWGNKFTDRQFKRRCVLEVTRMQSQMIPGTDVSVYEVLMMDEYRVARFLRNPTVKINPGNFKELFPLYGNILRYHFEKGSNQLSLQKQAISSCEALSLNFKSMPDEIKMNIVGRLSVVEIMNLKRACAQTAVV